MPQCFICQQRPAVGGEEVRCTQCIERMENPPHVHDHKPFKFSPDSNVTYWDCACGDRQMTAEDAD